MKKFFKWLFPSKKENQRDVQTSTAYDEYDIVVGGRTYRSDKSGQFRLLKKNKPFDKVPR